MNPLLPLLGLAAGFVVGVIVAILGGSLLASAAAGGLVGLVLVAVDQ